VVTDAPPPATVGRALRRAGTTVHVAAEDEGAATGVPSGAKA